jgi:hypothetical protein
VPSSSSGTGGGGGGGPGGSGTKAPRRSSGNKSHSRSYPRGVGLDFRKLAGLTLLSYIDHHGEYACDITGRREEGFWGSTNDLTTSVPLYWLLIAILILVLGGLFFVLVAMRRYLGLTAYQCRILSNCNFNTLPFAHSLCRPEKSLRVALLPEPA